MTISPDEFEGPVWARVVEGERQRQRGNIAAAIENFTQAIADFTTDTPTSVRVETYICRGVAWGQTGDHDSAIADFSNATTLAPDRALAYYNRAFAHEQKRSFEDAIAHYNRAISLKPNESGYYVRRGMTFKRLGKHRDARRDFETVRKLRKTETH